MRIDFDDLDDVELIDDIELSFGVRLPEAETLNCHTFGDLCALVARRAA